MNNCRPDIGTDPAYLGLQLLNVLNPVVYEENLSVTADLIFDSFLYNILVEPVYLSYDGHPVRRRSVYN